MLALIAWTRPSGVDFGEHMFTSIMGVIIPVFVFMFENALEPIIPVLKELESGPVCAFYPDTVWCNVSLAAVVYLLKGPGNSTKYL